MAGEGPVVWNVSSVLSFNRVCNWCGSCWSGDIWLPDAGLYARKAAFPIINSKYMSHDLRKSENTHKRCANLEHWLIRTLKRRAKSVPMTIWGFPLQRRRFTCRRVDESESTLIRVKSPPNSVLTYEGMLHQDPHWQDWNNVCYVWAHLIRALLNFDSLPIHKGTLLSD